MKTTNKVFWAAFLSLNFVITFVCVSKTVSLHKETKLLDKKYIRSEMNLYYISDTSARVSHYARGHQTWRPFCPECAELRQQGKL